MKFKAGNTLCPFLKAVSIMDLRMAKFSAASNTLNWPDIFYFTLTLQMARSVPLLSGGTSG
jgi:hypothetical protein